MAKKNYAIYNGVKREVSPSFMWDCAEVNHCLACQTCCACKNIYYKEISLEEGGITRDRMCKKYGRPPEKIDMCEEFLCDGFESDETSYDYEMVMRQIKDAKEGIYWWNKKR